MNNNLFSTVTPERTAIIEALCSVAKESSAKVQRAWIDEFSPYSQGINRHVTSSRELQSYTSLALREAQVTRLALIKEIDPDLWISIKGQTNLQLMQGGHSPYAFDDPTGVIELHHIGQNYDAPFAELTKAEHMMHGNSRVYHTSEESSWRKDEALIKQFMVEESEYWKCRARGNITILTEQPITPIQAPMPGSESSQLSLTIKEQMEYLLSECSIQDLRYIENLAGNLVVRKESGISSLSELICKDTSDESEVSGVMCTFCGARESIAYGYQMHAGEKVQRYRCKKCDKVFTVINRSIIYGCHFSFADWQRFLNCLENGISEEETAHLCRISKTTVHEYRLRVFYALHLLDSEVQLRGKVVMDEKYVAKSYKGNRSLQKDFSMDRKARKRGSEVHTPGLSKEQVCIETAMDEYGVSVARIAGLGVPSANRIRNAVEDVISKENVSCIFSDGETSLRKYARLADIPIRQLIRIPKNAKKIPPAYYSKENQETLRQVQRINSYHSRLEKFMSHFGGVSSRLLSGYLCLFAWKDRYRHDMEEGYRALFAILLHPNLYKTAEEIAALPIFREPTNHVPRKVSKNIASDERKQTIYARYMGGERVVDIAKDYGVSRAWIYVIINERGELASNGYQKKRQKQAEEKEQQRKLENIKYPYHFEKYDKRNTEIYEKWQKRSGTRDEFYDAVTVEYGLAKQTVKNIICRQKRIDALREPFYIHENYSYKTISEIYTDVFNRFLELSVHHPSVTERARILAGEFGYNVASIFRIIEIMRTGTHDSIHQFKNRTTKEETILRDRAIFVDCLRWRGEKADFITWAQEKYKLTPHYVYHILTICCYADYHRYEIS